MVYAQFKCTCGCGRVTVEDPPNDGVQTIERWCRVARKIVRKTKVNGDQLNRSKKD